MTGNKEKKVLNVFLLMLTPNFIFSPQKSSFGPDHNSEKIIIIRFALDFL